MHTIEYDVLPIPEEFRSETGITPVSFKELLGNADFISLSCPLVESNHHMLSSDAFEQMKDGVYIVNTSRGALIDEKALIDALEAGRVAGAALDVFEVEPLPPDSPLRRFDNCIFGTHNGSNTNEGVFRTSERAVRILLDNLTGSSDV